MISVAHKSIALLLCALPFGGAQALIDISPKILEMRDEKAEVRVSNTGDTPEFVTVTLYLVTNPGVPAEDEQLIPLGIVKDPHLYAAPFKLSLAPRQEKKVQLQTLTRPVKEKVYRLAVIPEQKVNVSGSQSGVIVVGLGFNGLVRQLPSRQAVTWQHQCGVGEITLVATGTVRVEFRELMINGKGADDFNVYPDAPRQLAARRVSGEVEGKPFNLQCDPDKQQE
ncbi:hypothetical protein [Serratia aquatilis]|uniref:Fimbria/pilus periplasmic chaperone n=1 Tax=Serratia aquatilis TaxID=1737515 RepID=A0ABV6ED42_9GAMM